MKQVYLLTGGNLGDRVASLREAVQAISQQAGAVLKQSALYETAAWGVKDQPDYLNQALEIETRLSPEGLLNTLLHIEKELGRLRQKKYGPRIIDIDILFYGGRIVKVANLTIPHPHIQDRRFVLVPLAEIAPDYRHPIFQKTIFQLLEDCPDPLNVKKFCFENDVNQVDL